MPLDIGYSSRFARIKHLLRVTMVLFRGVFLVLYTFTTLISLLVVTSSLYLSPVAVTSLCAVVSLLVSAASPRTALLLALVALPFGGNRPGTVHAEATMLVGAALCIGLTARYLFVERQRLQSLWADFASAPILLAAFLYVLYSCGSLVSLPWPHLLNEVRNTVDRSSVHAVAFSVRALTLGNEHSFFYSAWSVYLTSLSFLIGLFVWRTCRVEGPRTPQLLLGGVLAGLVISFAVGLLDYYGAISLAEFRQLDPVVNPNNKQFRLQSVFAHSGWYAEYITLTIPTGLVLLSLKAPFWLRAALVVSLLALGEFVLILTYQRGGWLSYPLTLVAVWAALYVVHQLERQRTDVLAALRRSTLKVLISLPITIAISLVLVFALQRGESAEEALSPYVSRFKDIQRTGDRTDFFVAGMLIGSKHPLMGAGSDSFAWQFEREFEDPTGSFAGRYNLPLHGSAHNVYAQTFSGKGFCGLVALLALPLLLIAAARRTIPLATCPLPSKLVILTGACCACAFLIYGNVQEVFYVQALQFLFFAVLAIVAAELPRPSQHIKLPLIASPALFLTLLSAHLAWEFIWPGTTATWYREYRPFGCYASERTPTGTSYRWCGEHSLILVPAGKAARITVENGPAAQELRLMIAETPSSEHILSLQPGERRQIELIRDDTGAISAAPLPVKLRASHSFVPHLQTASSNDMRRLAIKIIEE